jgi:hypothetical protein
MIKRDDRRGQLDLSFGMIFSIILIIIFLAFGVYAIIKFLDFQQSIQVNTFLNDFQNDVTNMWKSMQGSQTVTYTLPAKIKSVCFINDKFQNLRFTSAQIIPGKNIDHLDIAGTTKDENPFCVENVNGKVRMIIVKKFGETLVTVTR